MDCDRGDLGHMGGRVFPILVALILLNVTMLVQSGCSSEVDSTPSEAPPAPKVQHPSDRIQNAYDGGLGFVVPFRPECPPASVRKGAQPPEGFKEWCESTGSDAGMKHGWYAEWYDDGRPSVAG